MCRIRSITTVFTQFVLGEISCGKIIHPKGGPEERGGGGSVFVRVSLWFDSFTQMKEAVEGGMDGRGGGGGGGGGGGETLAPDLHDED